MSELAASAGCCCGGLLGADEVCELWRNCDSPTSLTVTFSGMWRWVMRWPDGSTWEDAGDGGGSTYAASGTATVTRQPDGRYTGTMTITVSGGGEVAAAGYTNCYQWTAPDGSTPPQLQAPWWPDCSRACENFRLETVEYAGTATVTVEVICAPIQIGQTAFFEVGTGIAVTALLSDSGTRTITSDFPDGPNPRVEEWSPFAAIQVGVTGGFGGTTPIVSAPGCPPGDGWPVGYSDSSTVSQPIRMGSVFNRELFVPPWFENICDTCSIDPDPVTGETGIACGDRIITTSVEWSWSLA